MNSLVLHKPDVAVVGWGEMVGKSSSYTNRLKSIVRYADPAAWAVVSAIGDACVRVEGESSLDVERTGIVLVSEDGPVETMATVAATARTGFLSPLRFPAATPGSLVGLSCIVFGFRGPTLNLTMPITNGVPIAAMVAKNWLERDVVNFVFVATYQSVLSARCLLLTRKEAERRDDQRNNSTFHQSHDLSWLLAQEGV